MIQIRHVPDEVHRTLKARAAQEGMSLSDYLLRELQRIAEKPTLEEWIARTKAFGPSDITSAEIVKGIRKDRDSR